MIVVTVIVRTVIFMTESDCKNFYTDRSTPCGSKISINLLVQKLFIESWWNWHQGSVEEVDTDETLANNVNRVGKEGDLELIPLNLHQKADPFYNYI